jgi:hypothetical protein
MLLCIWEINEIKSIEQNPKVKNIQKFNKTCTDLWIWSLDINKPRQITSQNIWTQNIEKMFFAQC